MPALRSGCTYCFATLDPSDPREELREFVSCRQCGALYHRFCWQCQGHCVTRSCAGTSADQIDIPSPSPLKTISKRRDTFYPAKIVYKLGNKTYTRGQLFLYSSLGVVTAVVILSMTMAVVRLGPAWFDSFSVALAGNTPTAPTRLAPADTTTIAQPATTSLATSEPAPRPAGTPTPLVTSIPPTPIPQTPTPVEQDRGLELARHWPEYYFEGFENNAGVWYTGDYKNTEGSKSGTLSIVDNLHHWQVSFVQSGTWWVRPTINPVADFYLSTEMKHTGGPHETSYGLIFRLQEEKLGNGVWSYYRFRINDARMYELSLFDKGNEATLIDWKFSDAILPGNTNRLTVIAQGSRFALYVNDQLVDEFNDERLDNGQVGLIIGLPEAGDALFLSDNFIVRVP